MYNYDKDQIDIKNKEDTKNTQKLKKQIVSAIGSGNS